MLKLLILSTSICNKKVTNSGRIYTIIQIIKKKIASKLTLHKTRAEKIVYTSTNLSDSQRAKSSFSRALFAQKRPCHATVALIRAASAQLLLNHFDKLIVLHSPIRRQQQLLGRLRRKSLYGNASRESL